MIAAISGALGPLDPSEWSIPSIGGLGADQGNAAGASAGSAGSDFGGMLTGAIDALEQTQAKGTAAAQALATGQLADPTQAVTAVEHAALAMDLASQIRTRLVEAATTVFQTQV